MCPMVVLVYLVYSACVHIKLTIQSSLCQVTSVEQPIKTVKVHVKATRQHVKMEQ